MNQKASSDAVYFRDDQALCKEIHLGKPSCAGLTFGLVVPDGEPEPPTWRIVWRPIEGGGVVWTFAEMYPTKERMAKEYPELWQALDNAGPTANVGEVCAVLESLGYRNARA